MAKLAASVFICTFPDAPSIPVPDAIYTEPLDVPPSSPPTDDGVKSDAEPEAALLVDAPLTSITEPPTPAEDCPA